MPQLAQHQLDALNQITRLLGEHFDAYALVLDAGEIPGSNMRLELVKGNDDVDQTWMLLDQGCILIENEMTEYENEGKEPTNYDP